MSLRRTTLLLPLLLGLAAHARKPYEPCRTKSRQMTLVKNCYGGEMASPNGDSLFFGALKGAGVTNYCYNSLVTVTQKPSDSLVRIRVLRDDKSGQFHAYDYRVQREELVRSTSEMPALKLAGLKGECFSAQAEGCRGGILKAIGWLDSDIPMTLGLNRVKNNQFRLVKLLQDSAEVERGNPKELTGEMEKDSARSTQTLIQEIRHRLIAVAQKKMTAMHSGVPAKQLADRSEQFRYCSMALDSFVKDKKLADPFSSDEKMVLSALTSYMNNDPGPPARMPASKR